MTTGTCRRQVCAFCCVSLLVFCALSNTAAGLPLEVEISGVEDELEENVTALLSIVEVEGSEIAAEAGSGEDDVVSPLQLRRLHRKAESEIRAALAPFGYYRADVDASLEQGEQAWIARYHIEAGPPTRVGEVEVTITGEGADLAPLRQVVETFPLAQGDVLRHPVYEEAKRALYDTAYDAGYLEAEWTASAVRVLPDREQANIELTLDTGPRYYFGDVTFDQDVLKPSLLYRFVAFEAGDPYDTAALLELQLLLNESNYFERVEVIPQREKASADRRIPILVATTTDSPRRYTIGVGYATDTGPRATLGALLRRVNRSGHRLRTDVQVSGIESAVALRYEIPIENVATDSLSFTSAVLTEEIGDAETEQYSLGASRNDGWRGFRRRLYLEAVRENFSFGAEPTQETVLLYPGIALTRDRADDLQYPRRGYGLSLDLRGGAEGVLSDVSFVRLDLGAGWVRGLGENLRLLLRGAAGALDTSSFDRLPPSQRFFAGGDRSIRGYGYQEVGARNAAGAVIGGRYQLIGSAELEYLFYGDFGAAVFVDTGDAFLDEPDFRTGAGLGFRWRSRIGMVRLDVAHPFDDPDEDYRIHLSIGVDI